MRYWLLQGLYIFLWPYLTRSSTTFFLLCTFSLRRWRMQRGPSCENQRGHRFFAAILSELDWVMLIQGKREFCLNNHEIWGKIHRLTFHHAQGLLWNWHLALVSKFKQISYKSPRNNSIKPFQFSLRVLSPLLASSFFLGLVIQKSATTATSKQQEIEMVCLGIKYYRGALKWLNTYTASLLW